MVSGVSAATADQCLQSKISAGQEMHPMIAGLFDKSKFLVREATFECFW